MNPQILKNIKKRIKKLIENETFKALVEDAKFNKEQSLLDKDELKINSDLLS